MDISITRDLGEIVARGRPAWKARLIAFEAALAANVIILAVARLVSGEFPQARMGGDDQVIGFLPVIVITALTGLAAWALLALLERTTSRATAIWTAIAIIVFALSLLGPLGSGADTTSKVVLLLLHLGAATPIIPLMRRSMSAREWDTPGSGRVHLDPCIQAAMNSAATKLFRHSPEGRNTYQSKRRFSGLGDGR